MPASRLLSFTPTSDQQVPLSESIATASITFLQHQEDLEKKEQPIQEHNNHKRKVQHELEGLKSSPTFLIGRDSPPQRSTIIKHTRNKRTKLHHQSTTNRFNGDEEEQEEEEQQQQHSKEPLVSQTASQPPSQILTQLPNLSTLPIPSSSGFSIHVYAPVVFGNCTVNQYLSNQK